MRKFALAALAVGAISTATHAPAEAHWRGEAGMAVGAARVWALDSALVPGRSALQRPHRPTITVRDTTRGQLGIMAADGTRMMAHAITARDIIARGTKALDITIPITGPRGTGDNKGPAKAEPFEFANALQIRGAVGIRRTSLPPPVASERL